MTNVKRRAQQVWSKTGEFTGRQGVHDRGRSTVSSAGAGGAKNLLHTLGVRQDRCVMNHFDEIDATMTSFLESWGEETAGKKGNKEIEKREEKKKNCTFLCFLGSPSSAAPEKKNC